MNQMNKIPDAMHKDIIGSFWIMLRELEVIADNNDDKLMKFLVAVYYRQWNEMCEDNKEPVWETRMRSLT